MTDNEIVFMERMFLLACFVSGIAKYFGDTMGWIALGIIVAIAVVKSKKVHSFIERIVNKFRPEEKEA